MQQIGDFITTYGPYLAYAISAAAAAMAVLPQGKPGGWWDQARTVINFLAQNYGHAKNIRQKGDQL